MLQWRGSWNHRICEGYRRNQSILQIITSEIFVFVTLRFLLITQKKSKMFESLTVY